MCEKQGGKVVQGPGARADKGWRSRTRAGVAGSVVTKAVFLVTKTCKFYPLSIFQIHNPVLLAVVPMLHTASPGRLYFMAGRLYF